MLNNGFQSMLILIITIGVSVMTMFAFKNKKTVEQCCLCGTNHDLEKSDEAKLTEYRENGYPRQVCESCEKEAEEKGFMKTKKRI